MWEVRCQFSKPMAEGPGTDLEWGAVQCDTQQEAEKWWDCRVKGRSAVRRVHTMFDPQGCVVKVKFN